MKITFADKLVAYLALISGLSISAVAVYYSVAGLVSIFAAAVIPIIVMGVTLELSKLVATVWLKQNWSIAPRLIRLYLFVAVMILMMITSMGIFGYLSKAHLDQNLVSGDVQGKIAVYDEKIKTERENIDANRKILKQLDESVDQVMARSQDEKGADKAVAIRKAQQKDRSRIGQEISQSQKIINTLNEERAPIAAEVRKVEAEVGPIKYIAALLYGDNPDQNVLEKAVRWVIIMIVVIFDPLAVILLLASQYSFQYFRKQKEELAREVPEQTALPVETLPIPVPPIVEEEPEVHSESVPENPDAVYPVTETEVEELAVAKEAAKEQTWDAPIKVVVEEKPVEEKLEIQLESGLEAALLKLIKEGEERGHWDAKDLEPALTVVPPAPPGTPGEAWDAPAETKSEQQSNDNIDKILNAEEKSSAKTIRDRSWFQAVFPKRDDK